MISSRRDVLRGSAAVALGMTWPGISNAADSQYEPVLPGRPAPPRSTFGANSTAEEVTAGLELDGLIALVTGCNSGIGFETMRVLANRGVHVFGAARTMDKAVQACDEVEGETTPLVVELTDFETIVAAAESIRAVVDEIDVLILNAGIFGLPELQQVNGIERQFVVNHLGHFLLTERLKDLLVAARQGRVVVVSSSAHVWAPQGGIQFDNLSGDKGYDPMTAYGQSKLANGLFSRELARRLADTRATSNSLHPGVIPTNIFRHTRSAGSGNSEPGPGMKSIAQGAATTCYVATHPDLGEVTGYYFSDCNQAMPSETMQDDDLAAKLWVVSEELTGNYR